MSATTLTFRLPFRTRDPGSESVFARACRLLADRRHLAELDPRLLRDVGLTSEDVARGVPFMELDRRG
jgi:hypothetical protein